MKILIDIGHPAHVHYFKNFIFKTIENGHKIKIIARDKEVTLDLLSFYNLDFENRGKGGISFFNKLIYFPYAILKFLVYSSQFKPDYFLSFASPYLPFVSWFFKKPLITIDDTEHDNLTHTIYKPFSSLIITPTYFQKDFGKKHVKINTIFELGSLHSDIFKPNTLFLKKLNPSKKKYALVRFVEWNATHDLNEKGFSSQLKEKIVNELSKDLKVFISSEGSLPENLEKYRLKISPEKIHDILFGAEVFIGDSGTMTVEAALLGTPSIMFSSTAKKLGNFISLRDEYSLLILCDQNSELLKLTKNLVKNKNYKNVWRARSKKFMNSKINFTEFLIWFFNDFDKNLDILLKKKNIENIKF